MMKHADKKQENQNRSVAIAVTQQKNNNESSFQLVDNRPEAIVQRKLIEIINNNHKSSLVKNPVNNNNIVQRQITTGAAMRGAVAPTNAQNTDIATLLGQITDVSALMRGAGTLFTQNQVRLDMQGTTGTGHYNLQIQIGQGTVATVLLNPNVTNAELQDVITAFGQSQNNGNVMQVDPLPSRLDYYKSSSTTGAKASWQPGGRPAW